MSHESSYESGQRFCLEPFQDGGESWIDFSKASWSIVISSQCHVFSKVSWSIPVSRFSKSVYKSVVKSPVLFSIFFFRFAQKRSNYFCLDLRFYCIGCHIILDIDLMTRVIFGN